MPKFKFRFERTYEIVEGFERVIEAQTLDIATRAAAELASSFNMACPDDCAESDSGGNGAGDFYADCISAEVHKASEPDYYVANTGECLPWEATDA